MATDDADKVTAIIEGLDDWRGATLARVRELIHEADPDVVEEIKWVKKTNPAGVSTWVHDGIICTGEVYKANVKLTAPVRKALLAQVTVRDPGAEPVRGKTGLEPDPELRDTEVVPLDEDVNDFLEREVLPFRPDAWVDHSKTKVGYEIPFTRTFYKYLPPRPRRGGDASAAAPADETLDTSALPPVLRWLDRVLSR